MRYDEGVENELKDWLSAAGETRQYITPRLVKEALRAIRGARHWGPLEADLPKRAAVKVQEYL